jgi:hypothetical protein
LDSRKDTTEFRFRVLLVGGEDRTGELDVEVEVESDCTPSDPNLILPMKKPMRMADCCCSRTVLTKSVTWEKVGVVVSDWSDAWVLEIVADAPGRRMVGEGMTARQGGGGGGGDSRSGVRVIAPMELEEGRGGVIADRVTLFVSLMDSILTFIPGV